MARELKVFSMSFLDLLCCALGGVILLSLLMILSMQQVASEAVKQTYFDFRTDVWVDFDNEIRTRCKRGEADPVKGDAPNRAAIDPDLFREEVQQLEFTVQILYHPLFGGGTGVKPRELAARGSRLEVHTVDSGHGGPARVSGLQGAEVFGKVDPFSLDNLILGRDVRKPSGPKRLYYKYVLETFARRVPHGYYFFVVRAKRRPAVNVDVMGAMRPLDTRTSAWMDMSGSGVAGRLLLQTHKILPEQIATDAVLAPEATARALDLFNKKHPAPAAGAGDGQEQLAKAQTARKRLRLPDRYDPFWVDAAGARDTEFVFLNRASLSRAGQPDAPGIPGQAENPDKVYSAYFAVRHRRGTEWPFGAGFPIPYPKGMSSQEVSPGSDEVRWGLMETYRTGPSGKRHDDDYYPPGLCITARHP